MTAFTYSSPDWGCSPTLTPRVLTVTFGDGYEQRVPDGLNTILPSWPLNFTKRTQVEAQGIYAWLIANNAHYTPFDWAAPGEGTATLEPFGTGDGARTQFTLVALSRPCTATPSAIYVNGVLKTLTTDYTVTGNLITFVVAPGAALPLTWTGTYTRKHLAVWTPPKPDAFNNWSISATFREVPA